MTLLKDGGKFWFTDLLRLKTVNNLMLCLDLEQRKYLFFAGKLIKKKHGTNYSDIKS